MSKLIDGQLVDLALFVRIVDFGGFTAAARASGVPQATISRRLAQLEKSFGVRLLDRTTRRVKLTAAGLRVYESARLMVDQAEAASAAANALKSEPSGALRIIAPVILGRYFIGDILAEFLSDHPKVNAKLELSGRSVDLVEEGFDIAIRIGGSPDSSLSQFHLGKTHTGLYVSPSYLVSRQLDRPEQLAAHPIMAPGSVLGKSELKLSRNGLTEKVAVTLRFVCTDAQPLLAAAERGLGVAVLPRFKGDAAAKTGAVVRILADWELPETIINALTPSSRGSLPAVRLFLEHAKQRLTEML
jgi:DNA-binding transcriptional LysR family regulator